jgi:sugar O-acyltransferase (sialic acid O-acetyltransferase NeuD family)
VTDLVIAGAGGFARETAAVVDAINQVNPTWRLLGFLDDDASLHKTMRSGVPVLAGLDSVRDELAHARVVVCVGNPRDYAARERIVARLGLPADRYATLVHPQAALASSCRLGEGTVVLAHTVATADVRVGAHVAVMPQVVLTHDDVVEDFSTIASGVRLGGRVTVARGAYVGAGALVREGRRIGAGALVGLGSVVLADVPEREVWVGAPARYLRAAP